MDGEIRVLFLVGRGLFHRLDVSVTRTLAYRLDEGGEFSALTDDLDRAVRPVLDVAFDSVSLCEALRVPAEPDALDASVEGELDGLHEQER